MFPKSPLAVPALLPSLRPAVVQATRLAIHLRGLKLVSFPCFLCSAVRIASQLSIKGSRSEIQLQVWSPSEALVADSARPSSGASARRRLPSLRFHQINETSSETRPFSVIHRLDSSHCTFRRVRPRNLRLLGFNIAHFPSASHWSLTE